MLFDARMVAVVGVTVGGDCKCSCGGWRSKVLDVVVVNYCGWLGLGNVLEDGVDVGGGVGIVGGVGDEFVDVEAGARHGR